MSRPVRTQRPRREERPGVLVCAKSPARRGFTIVELVIVGIIVAIMATVAVPRFAAAQVRYRADLVAQRVLKDLELARNRAMTTSKPVSVVFAASGYTLASERHLDRAGAYAVDLSAEPYRASIPAANFGGDATVVFDIYGQPDTGGEVTLLAGGLSRRITLNATSGKPDIQP